MRGDALENTLHVRLTAFLDLNPKSNNVQRYRTLVRGWERAKCLMLDRPNVVGGLAFRTRHPAAVRFMREGVVWGFYAEINQYLSERSDRLIWVSWPDEVSRVSLRRHDRIRISVPCEIYLENGGPLRGVLQDLSVGGCCIRTNVAMIVSARCEVSFTLPDGMRVDRLPVMVRRAQPAGISEFEYGCMFLDTAECERNGIGLFVVRMLSSVRRMEDNKGRILLFSPNAEDGEAMQALTQSSEYRVTVAMRLVDFFYHVVTCAPRAVILSAAQQELPAHEICRIIKSTPGLERLPVIIYGGEPVEGRQHAATAGASLYLKGFPNLNTILPIIRKSAPVRRKPQSVFAPNAEDSAEADMAACIPAAAASETGNGLTP